MTEVRMYQTLGDVLKPGLGGEKHMTTRTYTRRTGSTVRTPYTRYTPYHRKTEEEYTVAKELVVKQQVLLELEIELESLLQKLRDFHDEWIDERVDLDEVLARTPSGDLCKRISPLV